MDRYPLAGFRRFGLFPDGSQKLFSMQTAGLQTSIFYTFAFLDSQSSTIELHGGFLLSRYVETFDLTLFSLFSRRAAFPFGYCLSLRTSTGGGINLYSMRRAVLCRLERRICELLGRAYGETDYKNDRHN